MRKLTLAILIGALTGCAHTLATRVDGDAGAIEGDLQRLMDSPRRGSELFVRHDEPYIGAALVEDAPILDHPDLDTQVSVRSSVPMSLRELVEYLQATTGITFYLAPDIYGSPFQESPEGQGEVPSFTVSSFQGTARELLQSATAQTTTTWRYDDTSSTVVVSRYQTRIWPLAGFPGSASMNSTTNSSGQSGGGEGGSGGGSGAGGTGGGLTQISSTQSATGTQGTTVDVETNYFDDISNVIQSLLSPGGDSQVSPSTNTLVVTDTPVVLQQVDHLIEQMNDRIVSPILLQVDVYTITRDEREQYGADWTIAYETLRGAYGGNLISTGPNDADSAFAAAGVIDPDQAYAGSEVALQALSGRGFFASHRREFLAASPGRPGALHIGVDRQISQSPTQTLVPDAGVAVTPNSTVITDGISLTGWPIRLADDSVLFQMHLSITDTRAIETLEEGGFTVQRPTTGVNRRTGTYQLYRGRTQLIGAHIGETTNREQQGVGKPEWWALGGSNNTRKQSERLVLAVTLL